MNNLEHAASQALDLLTSLEAFEVTPELQGRIKPTVKMLSDSLYQSPRQSKTMVIGRGDRYERLAHLICGMQLIAEHPDYSGNPAVQSIYYLLWLAEDELKAIA